MRIIGHLWVQAEDIPFNKLTLLMVESKLLLMIILALTIVFYILARINRNVLNQPLTNSHKG